MSEPRIAAAVRRIITDRANGRCEYCLLPENFSPAAFCVEHIAPASTGGASSPDNLAFACPGCNGHKSNKTQAADPVTQKLFQLYHPRKDRWNRHFRWSDDAKTLEGRTGKGRATIEALKLNRPSLLNLRELLMLNGLHPPG